MSDVQLLTASDALAALPDLPSFTMEDGEVISQDEARWLIEGAKTLAWVVRDGLHCLTVAMPAPKHGVRGSLYVFVDVHPPEEMVVVEARVPCVVTIEVDASVDELARFEQIVWSVAKGRFPDRRVVVEAKSDEG